MDDELTGLGQVWQEDLLLIVTVPAHAVNRRFNI
jgi:hypothetical protein